MNAAGLLFGALLAGAFFGIYVIAWHQGRKYGEHTQRVADITESWARMQPRDNLGRYRRAEK